MRFPGRPVLLACAVLLLACRAETAADPLAQVYEDFGERVDEYVALRNRLADSLGSLDESWTQAEIAARATALANAVVAARPRARQGDIFTPEIAAVLVTLIKEEYSRRPPVVIETRGDTQEELPDFVPEVNQLYPTTYPLATFPPSLLPILPRLPEVVEYRVVTRYLILRDVEANLVIDFIPRAVPPVQ